MRVETKIIEGGYGLSGLREEDLFPLNHEGLVERNGLRRGQVSYWGLPSFPLRWVGSFLGV